MLEKSGGKAATSITIAIAATAAIIYGIIKLSETSPLKCDDPRVTSTARDLVIESIDKTIATEDVAQFINSRIVFDSPFPIGYDEKIKRYSCQATLKIDARPRNGGLNDEMTDGILTRTKKRKLDYINALPESCNSDWSECNIGLTYSSQVTDKTQHVGINLSNRLALKEAAFAIAIDVKRWMEIDNSFPRLCPGLAYPKDLQQCLDTATKIRKGISAKNPIVDNLVNSGHHVIRAMTSTGEGDPEVAMNNAFIRRYNECRDWSSMSDDGKIVMMDCQKTLIEDYLATRQKSDTSLGSTPNTQEPKP